MRGGWGGVAVVMALWLISGCYATIHTPPGPNCIVDPSNPACPDPLTDKNHGGRK